MDAADLRSRVVNMEHKLQSIDARTTIVEQWRAQMDVFNARRDEQFTNLMAKFVDLEKKIDGVSGSITTVVRMIMGAVIVFIVGFAFKGGFNLP